MFNFFDPDLIPQGKLAAARQTSPEFKAITQGQIFLSANYQYRLFHSVVGGYQVRGAPNTTMDNMYVDWTMFDGMEIPEIVDWIDLVFTANTMRPETRASLLTVLPTMAAVHQPRAALHSISMSPEFATQP